MPGLHKLVIGMIGISFSRTAHFSYSRLSNGVQKGTDHFIIDLNGFEVGLLAGLA
jgi:hypothetical protein